MGKKILLLGKTSNDFPLISNPSDTAAQACKIDVLVGLLNLILTDIFGYSLIALESSEFISCTEIAT